MKHVTTKEEMSTFEIPDFVLDSPLERAFASLKEDGIRAEPCFSCCHEHGGYRMMTEQPGRWAGFCFYHLEDVVECSRASQPFTELSWMSVCEGADRLIVNNIKRALEAEGLKVEWGGCPLARIRVELTEKDAQSLKARACAQIHSDQFKSIYADISRITASVVPPLCIPKLNHIRSMIGLS